MFVTSDRVRAGCGPAASSRHHRADGDL